MKLNLLKQPKSIISFLFILGGSGSIIFGLFPIIGSVMIILGILGSLFSFLTSESRNQELDFIIEAQATLFAQHGLGNIYTQAFKKELFKTGSVKSGFRLLKKALDVDPNDMDALSLISSSLSLRLSLQQWLGVNIDSSNFKKTFTFTKELAQRGIKFYPKSHIYLDTLGILFDIEGNHKKARQHFNRSGRLRNDPYWRLLVATSWHKSGEHRKALNELKIAESEKAKGWLFNFYYGRALNSIGNHIEAIKYLKSAFQERGYNPNLLFELSQSYFLTGRFFSSAKYVIKLSLRVLSIHPITGFKYFIIAIGYIGIGLACFAAKTCWKVVRYIPFIRNLQVKILSPDLPEFILGNMLMGYCQVFCVKFDSTNSLKNGRFLRTFPIGFDFQCNSILRQIKARRV